VSVVRESIEVDLPAERAFELWTDIRRWGTFIDDFANAERIDENWPRAGAKLVWKSKPHGRGQVTEKVLESEPPRLLRSMHVEERLNGTQTVSFEPYESGGAIFELELEYSLSHSKALGPITDFLFIRRAVRDSLARTCRRFAAEAAEEARL
jgi:uncharacterized membrane protein